MTTQITLLDIQDKAIELTQNGVKTEVSEFVQDVINAHFAGIETKAFDVEELYNALYDEEYDEYIEPCQWWVVSEDLGKYMKEVGEFILIDMNFGYLWARKGAGYPVYEDLEPVAEYLLTK